MRLIGYLWYLCKTRHDLAYIVGIMRRFMGKPKESHLATLKRILRYVKCSIAYGILFPATDRGRVSILLYYTDSNWYGDKKRENMQLDTSLCMEKHQSFGVLRTNQLWRSLLARLSTLHHLCVCVCVCVKLYDWWIWWRSCVANRMELWQ